MHRQVKVAAVKLVLAQNFTAISSSEVGLGFDDLHLKGVNLQPKQSEGGVVVVVGHKITILVFGYADDVSLQGLDVLSSLRTFVLRSKVSFSCRCFPDLLARSIHFPLNHLMVGFFSRDSAFTLATKVMFSPGHDESRFGKRPRAVAITGSYGSVRVEVFMAHQQ